LAGAENDRGTGRRSWQRLCADQHRSPALADKAYDSNAIRDLIEHQGAVPDIPSKANRRWKSCFSRSLYKGRNAVERMFCRLKDYRRIATRYDKLATNFLSPIYPVSQIVGGAVPDLFVGGREAEAARIRRG
jgi:transposase